MSSAKLNWTLPLSVTYLSETSAEKAMRRCGDRNGGRRSGKKAKQRGTWGARRAMNMHAAACLDFRSAQWPPRHRTRAHNSPRTAGGTDRAAPAYRSTGCEGNALGFIGSSEDPAQNKGYN
ncbi:unnamed protein product, partial [Iphiclides podalirius]